MADSPPNIICQNYTYLTDQEKNTVQGCAKFDTHKKKTNKCTVKRDKHKSFKVYI